ncbi:hypothetical protein GW7_05278 [Heterocephalus glaber]|uniref:Uncharacterized protein n=1 Tax=Heterocephalus glaber TaxID=10181 RepID=G5BA95_HETGA|nr:hypothetical protein GW7_05278 [Heterocephalus glaber]
MAPPSVPQPVLFCDLPVCFQVAKKSSRARRPGPRTGKKLSPRASPRPPRDRRRKPQQGLAVLSTNRGSSPSKMRQGSSRALGARKRCTRRGPKRSPAKLGRNRSTRGRSRGRRAPASRKTMPMR